MTKDKKPLTNVERQKRFVKNMHNNGFVCVKIWIPAAHKLSFLALARKLRSEGHISNQSLFQYFPNDDNEV